MQLSRSRNVNLNHKITEITIVIATLKSPRYDSYRFWIHKKVFRKESTLFSSLKRKQKQTKVKLKNYYILIQKTVKRMETSDEQTKKLFKNR